MIAFKILSYEIFSIQGNNSNALPGFSYDGQALDIEEYTHQRYYCNSDVRRDTAWVTSDETLRLHV